MTPLGLIHLHAQRCYSSGTGTHKKELLHLNFWSINSLRFALHLWGKKTIFFPTLRTFLLRNFYFCKISFCRLYFEEILSESLGTQLRGLSHHVSMEMGFYISFPIHLLRRESAAHKACCIILDGAAIISDSHRAHVCNSTTFN